VVKPYKGKGKKSPAKDEIDIKLAWPPVQDTPTFYANQMLITHALGEFYLIFGEFVPSAAELKNKTGVVRPIVKIAMTTEMMQRAQKAINSNVEKWLKRQS